MPESHPKRVLMLCSRHNALDGRVFQLEAKALVAAGHQVTIVAPMYGDEASDEMIDGIRILRYQKLSNSILRKFHTVYTLVRFAVQTPADVLHVHEVDSSLVAGAIAKKRLARFGRQVKLLFDSHEVWPYFFATFRKAEFLRRIIVHLVTEFEHLMVRKHVDVMIAAHELETNYYLWQDPWTPAFCVFGAPPLESWEKPAAKRGPIRTIGHDGFFSLHRGMDVMLDAFEHLAPDYPELNFLAAGDFMNPEDKVYFDKWAARTGLGDRVETVGWVDRSDVLMYLERMDIGLVANRPDIHSVRCWPANKMMFYMGRGIPVVSTPVPLYRRYIDANYCGRVADRFSGKSLADALRELLDNPKETRKMGMNGYKAVLRDFNSRDAIQNLHAAYEALDKNIQRLDDEQVTLQG